jgi:signal recognition particle receptor subunit beta
MAVFDPVEQRMCVRVVYDGAAGAGKSTNIRQLGNLFAAQRTAEVISPAELRGRTLYFDWMRITAGVVCGFPLICQVISVPGQVAFTERRRALLAAADVVVYVCDSTKTGTDRARDAFHIIDEIGCTAAIPPPIVLQANKQDQVDVFDGKGLAAAIGRLDLTVIEAIATEGIGVVDTFVSAVRTVSRTLQARMERDGLRVPVRRAPEMKQVLAQVASAPIEPYGAAELLLEEASAALLFDRAHRSMSLGLARKPVARESAKRASAADGAPSDAIVAPEVDAVRVQSFRAPFPNADVPTGFIWPAHTGRATLGKLGRGGALADSIPIETSSVECVIEDHVLTTSPAARFAEPDGARHALVRAARERTQLGSLLVNDTVLVVQPASDGMSWLWTVTPSVEPIEAWLAKDDRETRLETLAAAIVQAVVVSLRHSIGLVPSIRAFGVQHGTVRYKGPIETPSSEDRRCALLLHRAASELTAVGHDVEIFTAAVERELSRRLDPREIAVLASTPIPQTGDGSQVACELLTRAIDRLATVSTSASTRALTLQPAHSPEAT